MPIDQQWVAFYTIVAREIRRFMRIWQQTLLPPAITMLLYFVIFGNLVGSRIGNMGEFSYMEFIVPGLIMMTVITNAYNNVVSSFFSIKFQHSVEELLVSPVPNYVIIIGYVSGGVARGVLVGSIVTLCALCFTQLPLHNLWVVFSIVILTATLFSLGGFINAIYARNFDDVSIIPTFVLTPLTYLGGVFFSITMLSDGWRALAQINPILHMVNTFRYGMLGVSEVNIVWAYAIILTFIGIFYAYCLYLLKKGVGLRH